MKKMFDKKIINSIINTFKFTVIVNIKYELRKCL